MELKSLRDSEAELAKLGVAYFMVSLDDPAKNEKWAGSLSGNFPVLSDPGKEVAEAYGVLGFAGLFAKRWTFYISEDGIVRHIDKNVSPSSAGPDIVRQVEELGLAGSN